MKGNAQLGFAVLEIIKKTVLVTAAVFLFFDGIIGFLLLIPVEVYYFFKVKKSTHAYRMKLIFKQFKDVLLSFRSSLEAGQGMECAVGIAVKDLEMIYGNNCVLKTELMRVDKKLALGENLESAFEEFAVRNPLSEISDFSGVLQITKRTGGNVLKPVKSALKGMYDKAELTQELETSVAPQLAECAVMKIMPLLILMYMRLFSGEFFSGMYESGPGKAVMLLGAYAYFALLEYTDRLIGEIL